jgi:hypothetical protein
MVLVQNEFKLLVSKVESLLLYNVTTLNVEDRFDSGEKKSISNILVSPCMRILIIEEVEKFIIWDIQHKQKVYQKKFTNPKVLKLTNNFMLLTYKSKHQQDQTKDEFAVLDF